MDLPRITAYSTALFSTWIFLEEYGVLLDCGDGVMSALLHKSRKVRHVAMTHADRDHVMGLFQLNHHNGWTTLENIFYPADSGSFPAIRNFCARFDPDVHQRYAWVPVHAGEAHTLDKNLLLRPVANDHIDLEGATKSVGYVLCRTFRKLRAEYESLPQKELARLGTELGSDALSEPREERLIGYSGDTGVCPPEHWAGCRLLIHEATFLSEDDIEMDSLRHSHSAMAAVLAMARDAGPEALVLMHFSSRYKPDEVRSAVAKEAASLRLSFPVYVIPPGEVARNLFDGVTFCAHQP